MGLAHLTSVIFLPFVLLTTLSVVNGIEICRSTKNFFDSETRICENGYCCGEFNLDCCRTFIPSGPTEPFGPSGRTQEQTMEVVAAFIVVIVISCCCVCCYRCCCRRTTSRGFVYSTPGATTAVSVTLPPQSQQVPYPNVVPYPQQTPYPPQYNPPTNPYYGMPPPAYGVAVNSGHQQASAPSAPYIQS